MKYLIIVLMLFFLDLPEAKQAFNILANMPERFCFYQWEGDDLWYVDCLTTYDEKSIAFQKWKEKYKND